MPSSMLIHDRRLAGNPPRDMAANVYEVNENVPIAHALGWIAEYARRSGGLTDLYVMCHGFEGNWDLQNQQCTTDVHGGFGLQLCQEGLSLYNATGTSVLSGRIAKITIFSCATADAAPYNTGTGADGMRFCGEIALWTRGGSGRGRADANLQHEPHFLAVDQRRQPGGHHRFRRVGGAGVQFLARQPNRAQDSVAGSPVLRSPRPRPPLPARHAG